MWRTLCTVLLSLSVAACASLQGGGDRVDPRAENVRELLRLSSEQAASELAGEGAYTGDNDLRLTIPSAMSPIADAMRQYGFGNRIEYLEELMNLGAEQAARRAGPVLHAVIGDLSIDNAREILRGRDDAATRYLLAQVADDVALRYRPVIRASLRELGFYDAHRLVLDLYESLPVPAHRGVDLERHVLHQSLGGLYRRMAAREAAIRANPEEFASEQLARALRR